jgi:hypothetical protein
VATKAHVSYEGGGGNPDQQIQQFEETIPAVRRNTKDSLDEIHASSSDDRILAEFASMEVKSEWLLRSPFDKRMKYLSVKFSDFC